MRVAAPSTDGRPSDVSRSRSAGDPASPPQPERAGRIRRSARTTPMRWRASGIGLAPRAAECGNGRDPQHRPMAARVTRVVRDAPVDRPRAHDPSGRGGPRGPPLRRRRRRGPGGLEETTPIRIPTRGALVAPERKQRDAGDEATQGCDREDGSRVRANAAAEPTRNMGGAAIAAGPDARHQPTTSDRRDPGAGRLRVSASAVTRGMRARRSSTGAGGSRVTRDETEHTPDNNGGAAIAAGPDARHQPTARNRRDRPRAEAPFQENGASACQCCPPLGKPVSLPGGQPRT